ncbi:hypothetical protein [Rhabdothermincola salaria]|uniref:hypothetical protein n=1 Tax=Rhabdothermincola salaria TaxID=2903142 RepID=UPI001E4ABA89|nr:hypothetical protein [Rhabdothermincola salaria]MCD9623748.1 hypothetical protein [Rhabdothermincola salaria]
MALLAGLLLAACGSSGSAAPATSTTTEAPPSSTTTSTPTTTEAPTPEAEIEAVYRAFWDATITANNPPDPGSPALAESMADPMLAHVTEQVANRLETGQAIRLPEGSLSSVSNVEVEVVGEEATVMACVVDDAVVFDRASGLVLNDRVTSGWTRATVRLVGDGWRVVSNEYTSRSEGVDGCAP